METIMEDLMVAAFCAAVGFQIYRFVKNKTAYRVLDRITVILMGAGFITGAILKGMLTPVPWTFVLYILGAMLCYAATVFSFPPTETEMQGGSV